MPRCRRQNNIALLSASSAFIRVTVRFECQKYDLDAHRPLLVARAAELCTRILH
jgi:hypothetical protein